MDDKKEIVVVLVGQPNVGKTMLINKISGSNLHVGNFTGVTIEKAESCIKFSDYKIRIIDLPGTYSINEYSQEEKITTRFLLHGEYDLILNVVDSTNLERNLFLTTQLMSLNKKILIALNMCDEANNEGIFIDEKELSRILGIKSVLVSAKIGCNVISLLNDIVNTHLKPFTPSKRIYGENIESEIEVLENAIIEKNIATNNTRHLAINLLSQDEGTYRSMHDKPYWIELNSILQNSIKNLYASSDEKNIKTIFFNDNYAYARGASKKVCKVKKNKRGDNTSRIDFILLNKYIGIPVFLFFMWILFNLTFTIGSYPQEWIENGFAYIGELVVSNIENESIASLISDGVIGGVGTVLSFLPLILILFLGIILLETTGYMARVSFLLDGFLHKFGLHGKSFIPLVSGFGCSIPAYMSTRMLKNNTDKLITMFVIGFMSCSARLPVYVLFIGSFFDEKDAGNVLFGIYILGAIIGLVMAKLLKVMVFKGQDEPFVMEMPKYRIPSLHLVLRSVWFKAYFYVKKAGTFIFMASILIWFTTQYPKDSNIQNYYNEQISALESKKINEDSKAIDDEILELQNKLKSELLVNSYLGKFGNFINPIFAPLNFDWRLTTSLITGIAAKEVVVSTMGVLYSLGEIDENSLSLREIIGKQVSFPVAVGFILFVMLYLPCFAATIVFIKESGKAIYGVYLFLFTSIVAYVIALIGFYITKLAFAF